MSFTIVHYYFISYFAFYGGPLTAGNGCHYFGSIVVVKGFGEILSRFSCPKLLRLFSLR
jgi:hypothetical protein